MDGFGAFILGRNMFAHSRGKWTSDGWKGWWGENPPISCTDVHFDPICSRATRDGGRHDLPFRDRRYS
jgi:hypothetical protein